MNDMIQQPFELVVAGRTTVIAYACKTCGRVFTVKSYGGVPDVACTLAKECCEQHCSTCGAYRDEAAPAPCSSCMTAALQDLEQSRLDRARRLSIEEYVDLPVFWRGHHGNSLGDGYFDSIAELLDHCEENGLDLPTYVWACTEEKLSISAADLLATALAFHAEDAAGWLLKGATDELQALLDAWCTRQAVQSVFQDFTRVVVLCPDGPPLKVFSEAPPPSLEPLA